MGRIRASAEVEKVVLEKKWREWHGDLESYGIKGREELEKFTKAQVGRIQERLTESCVIHA